MTQDTTREQEFQTDLINALIANGWQLGSAKHYHRESALYTPDLLDFVKETQPGQWEKYEKLYPNDPEGKFLERVTDRLNRSDPQAAAREMRTYGALDVLRHDIKDRGVRFRLCRFKPEHDLNPDTLERYRANCLRVVPEMVYSEHTNVLIGMTMKFHHEELSAA